MVSIPTEAPQSQALLTALRRAWPRVGYCEAPDDETAPYAVLWPLSSLLDGPMGDRFADLYGGVQVTCVGTDPEQAMSLRDRLRTAVLGADLAIAGRTVLQIRHTTAQPVTRDDALGQPRLFYAVDQYSVDTTPA